MPGLQKTLLPNFPRWGVTGNRQERKLCQQVWFCAGVFTFLMKITAQKWLNSCSEGGITSGRPGQEKRSFFKSFCCWQERNSSPSERAGKLLVGIAPSLGKRQVLLGWLAAPFSWWCKEQVQSMSESCLIQWDKREAVFLKGKRNSEWKLGLVLFINIFICRESPARQRTSPERL